MKIAIVSPCHIQPSPSWIAGIQREVAAFKEGKEGVEVDVIIVDDSDGKLTLPNNWRVYGYKAQEDFLGDLYQQFADTFHKSSSCRAFGHLVAMSEGYSYILGLDSDCIVPFNFISAHLAVMGKNGGYGWTNPIASTGMYSRGYPYSKRNWKIAANVGLWENVLDINGKDRVENEPKRVTMMGNSVVTAPIPFSGMNFCLSVETAPLFLFLPNFENTNEKDGSIDAFRRVDDVWGGYIYQVLLRKMKQSVIYGSPVVFHDTVVIAAEDAAEEAAMYKHEDDFIETVDETSLAMANANPNAVALMENFIHNWKGNIDMSPFQELTAALDWWGKAIQKYA